MNNGDNGQVGKWCKGMHGGEKIIYNKS